MSEQFINKKAEAVTDFDEKFFEVVLNYMTLYVKEWRDFDSSGINSRKFVTSKHFVLWYLCLCLSAFVYTWHNCLLLAFVLSHELMSPVKTRNYCPELLVTGLQSQSIYRSILLIILQHFLFSSFGKQNNEWMADIVYYMKMKLVSEQIWIGSVYSRIRKKLGDLPSCFEKMWGIFKKCGGL